MEQALLLILPKALFTRAMSKRVCGAENLLVMATTQHRVKVEVAIF